METTHGLVEEHPGQGEAEYIMGDHDYNSVWITCGKLSINLLTREREEGLLQVSSYVAGHEDEDPIERFTLRQPM